MQHDQFEALLSLHGGDLSKWPEAMRAAAERLVADDERAARLLADAARLDHLLAEAVRPLPVDATTVGRIIAGIGNGRGHEVTVRPTRRLLAWASAAMAASLVAGFAIGVILPADQGEDAMARLVFGSSSTTISEDGGSLL